MKSAARLVKKQSGKFQFQKKNKQEKSSEVVCVKNCINNHALVVKKFNLFFFSSGV
jgi:hypothetical protein